VGASMKNIKKIGIAVVLIVVCAVAISGLITLNVKLSNEIVRVIHSKGGKVIKKEIVQSIESPFDKSSKGNRIYKVIYVKDGHEHVAWYRSTKNPINIHKHTNNDQPEAWIFTE
jgi:hypothetical protein